MQKRSTGRNPRPKKNGQPKRSNSSAAGHERSTGPKERKPYEGREPGKKTFERRESDKKNHERGASDRKNHDRREPGSRKPFPTRAGHVAGKRADPAPALPSGFPLNKYIAHCGICSRRKAVDFIKDGKVTVNGEAISEPGYKVEPKDVIKLNGKKISVQQKLVYLLLNKPKGFLTTTDDPEGRRTVMELVADAAEEARIYPVGRLDRNTSGLLLLTNDGELAQKLAHPGNGVRKVYHVGLDKPLSKADFDRILAGVKLEDGVATVDSLAYVDPRDKTQIGLEIHIGRNRIVRRLFEHLDYKVEKLDRVLYAGLTKKNIPRGKYRFLTEKEVILLKHFK